MSGLPSSFYPNTLDLAAQAAAGTVEYLRVKVFLYKYTPPFTFVGEVTSNLSAFDQYSVPLAEQYFSKYDISNYVTGYTFDQDLYGNTFNWSLTLQDHIATQQDFTQVLNADVPNQPILNNAVTPPITGPVLAATSFVPNTSQGMQNLGEYEVMTPTPYDNELLINPAVYTEAAKINRGFAESELTDKLGGGAKVTGIRLSDLIQMYDMVSVFLYKENSPLESVTGTVSVFQEFDTDSGQTINIFRFVPSSTGAGAPLTPQNLQSETILLSPYPNNPSKTIFSNEFNGFVMNKTFTRDISGVDQVSISGNGITRLLGATRRIIKPSLLQNAIYQELSQQNINSISAFQTIFAGRPLINIVTDLMTFVYNISFDLQTDASNTTVTAVNNSWFDISALQIGNQLQSNIFTVPPYLLSIAMKRRLFNWRQIPLDNVASLASQVPTLANGGSTTTGVQPATPDQLNAFLTEQDAQQNSYFTGTQPVQIDQEILNLQTYFQFLANVYEFFNPKLNTPFEVLDDVKKNTFAEIFERPDGSIVLRNPQYNNVVQERPTGTSTPDIQSVLHFSSNYNVISANYSETVNDLVSKMKVTNAYDFINTLLPTQENAYTDGKYLLQFGFLESSADANPNAKNTPDSDDANNLSQMPILIRYAEYFLRYHNAKLKTGTVILDLDNTIRIGDTFFDEKNYKFGYIIGISKAVSPGQPATMTLNLSFVRDAYNAVPSTQVGTNLQFDILPTLQYVNGSATTVTP